MSEEFIENALRVLNDALSAEPETMQLVFKRHPMRDSTLLAEHPTIQIGKAGTLSALGLINGILGVNPIGWGHIAAECDPESGRILRFIRTPDRKAEVRRRVDVATE
jgi:hypothetical protein